MNKIEFKFSDDIFNRLFPFYILINKTLKIESIGTSLSKICPLIKRTAFFNDIFIIKSPSFDRLTFNELLECVNQLTIIEDVTSGILLRGQFEISNDSILFVGVPCFYSLKEVENKSLTKNDFALHDLQIDLLNIIKDKESTCQELKELAINAPNLKNNSKLINEENKDISYTLKNQDVLIQIDLKGNIISTNSEAEPLTYLMHEGKLYEKEDFFKHIVNKIDLDKEYFIFEASTKDIVYSFLFIIFKENGYINIYGRDFKVIKKNQVNLKHLSLVASANENGVIFTKPNGIIFWCNDSYLKLTGYSKDEVIGKTPVDIGKTELIDQNELKKTMVSFYKGESFNIDLVHGRKDQSSFWARTKGQPIINSKGKVVEYFAVIENISLKKKFEESLLTEKEKYRNIIANMNLGMLEVDEKDQIVLANDSFCEMSGYSLEELKGKNPAVFLATKESQDLIKMNYYRSKKGEKYSCEVRIMNKNQQKRHWLVSGSPNYDTHGKAIGTIGIYFDITKQKEQEEKLYILSLIAEKNINAVIISDKEGKIEWANESFLQMSEYEMDDIIGQKPTSLLYGIETNKETIGYLKNRTQKGLPFKCEILNYTKSGNKYWVNINGQALYDKNKKVLKYFTTEENITEKKKLELQRGVLIDSLAKSNKELEDYASVVSHDLKSPLRSIHTLVGWIIEDNDKELSDKTLNYMSMVKNKVEKMDHLIEGILTYAKIDKVDKIIENVNTQEIVQNIIDIIHIQSHIQVLIKDKLPTIKADRFRVHQLFQNLINNAVKYNDKPTGIINVEYEETSSFHLFSIIDNGPGIAKKNQEKIFKIFQSLGTTGKSTGLGLSIVKKIVEFYNGEIWIESKLGYGSTFFVKLPKTAKLIKLQN